MKKILPVCFVALLFAGCRTSHVITAWKNPRPAENYQKIMVAGVINTPDDSLRKRIEKNFVDALRNLGYNAISGIEEFGSHGLENMAQEQTYIALCNRGIDAVITIALIDQSKADRGSKISYGYPNNYYYNRIWNYKNIYADLSNDNKGANGKYFWESILFNLRTLEAECTIQTKPFPALNENKIAREFEKNIIKEMINEKVIRKIKSDNKKPF